MIDHDEYIPPTRERLAKAGDDIAEFISESGRLTYRMKDSPIDRLAFGKKAKITPDQYSAALRLYQDAYGAGLMPSGVIDPAKERVDGGQYKDISDIRIACQVRYEHAIKILAYEYFIIVEAIVIQEVSLPDYAERFASLATRRERQAAALITLQHGLDALARHYDPKPAVHSSIRSGHVSDYKPANIPSERQL